MIKVIFGSELLGAVVGEIERAESSVYVAMFEWAWYPGQHTGTVQDLNRAVCIKGKSGTDVRVLLHNESIGRPLHRLNRQTAEHLKQSKVMVKWGNSRYPLHAKVWIFDGARVILGSHNISVRAVQTNYEASILFDVPSEVKRVVEWFEELWEKGM